MKTKISLMLHVVIGIFIWVITLLELIYQLTIKNLSIPLQFIFYGLMVLLSTNNQTILMTKLWLERKNLKNNLSIKQKILQYPAYAVFTAINLIYIFICLFTMLIAFFIF
ncbi:MAG TPA: hypothetical protein IAB23_07885 [Candidatus Scybalocola faecavium]|nr:hypothetical protein [Candidatus Scybalocola faecavium]